MPNNMLKALLICMYLSIGICTIFNPNTMSYPAPICTTSKPLASTTLVQSLTVITDENYIPQIDYYSYVETATEELVSIRLEITEPTTGNWLYTFTSVGSTLLNPIVNTVNVISSTKPTFIGFSQNVFVLKDGANYKAFVINTANYAVLTGLVLNPPSTAYANANTITGFIMIKASSQSVPVLTVKMKGQIGDGATSYDDFIDYTLSPGGATDAKSNDVFGSLIGFNKGAWGDVLGGPQLYFDRGLVINTIAQLLPGSISYAVPSNVVVPPFDRLTDIVQYYRLKTYSALVYLQSPDKFAGRVVWTDNTVNSGTINAFTFKTLSSTVVVKQHSEGVQNLLVINNKQVFWLNSKTVPATIAFVDPGTPFTGADLQIYTSDYVSMSGDKAFALYEDHITAFRLVSSTQIDLYKVISTGSNNAISGDSSLYIEIKITCSCKTNKVTKFTCFSLSLNCFIASKVSWIAC